MKKTRRWQKITAVVMILAVVLNFFWAQKNFAIQEDIDKLNAKKHVFLSDLKYDSEKTRVGWKSVFYDKNAENNQITLNVDGKNEKFAKGVYAHADSLVAYNIEGMNFDKIQGYFGIDTQIGANSDGVKMILRADEKNLLDGKPELSKKIGIGQSVFFDVEIPTGTKYLYVGSDKAGNNHSDWSVFGGVKLVKNDYVAPKIDGVEKIEKLDEKLRSYATAEDALTNAEFDILKREFLRRVGYKQLLEMMETSEERQLAIEWLMRDVKNLRNFLMAGEPNSNYSDALQVLGRLLKKYEGDLSDNTTILRGTKGDLYTRMMMALAVAHSRPACFWLDTGQCSDAVERYGLYKEMYADGLLKKEIFETIETEEMRWIMEGMLTDKELKWLNYYSRIKRMGKAANEMTEVDKQNVKNVQPELDPYMYIKYTFDYKYDLDKYYTGDGVIWKNRYGFDEFGIKYGMVNVGGKEQKQRRLWMVFEEGAVCGGISKTGTNLLTAFGIPGSVIGQPGHAAYLRYEVQGQYRAEDGEDYRAGTWSLGNDISGWVESEKGERLLSGWGYGYQRFKDRELGAYNVSYMLLTQNNLNRYADYVKAREMSMLAEMYLKGNISGSPKSAGRIENIQKIKEAENDDVVKAEAIYNELLRVAPRDYEGWKGLVVSYLKDQSKNENDYAELAERLAEGLKEYPLPMADLVSALEDATRDASIRSRMRLARNAALESVVRNAQMRKDFLQPNAAKDMANRILGRQEKILTFSFDGENAGSIVLGSSYANREARYEYSVDGKRTWKETSEKIHKLTDEELAQVTEENDIVVHFIGDGGKFGDGGNLDPNDPEHLKRAIVIDIKRQGPFKIMVNDLENKVVGDTDKVEWQEFGASEWRDLTNDTKFEGDREIVVRKKNNGVFLHGNEVNLSFKKDEENKEKQYIPIRRIKIESVSSDQADRNNKKEYAVDGSPCTFWHSAWNGSDNRREIVLKTDKPIKLRAFEYLPRQDEPGGNGTVLTGEVLVSDDGVNFKSVAKEKWARNSSMKRVELAEPVAANFVKFVGVETVGGYISAAMLNLYEDVTEEVVPEPKQPEAPKSEDNKGEAPGSDNGGGETPKPGVSESETPKPGASEGGTSGSSANDSSRESDSSASSTDNVPKNIKKDPSANDGGVDVDEIDSNLSDGNIDINDVPVAPSSSRSGSVSVVGQRNVNGVKSNNDKVEDSVIKGNDKKSAVETEKDDKKTNAVEKDQSIKSGDEDRKNDKKDNSAGKNQGINMGVATAVIGGIVAGVTHWFVLGRRRNKGE